MITVRDSYVKIIGIILFIYIFGMGGISFYSNYQNQISIEKKITKLELDLKDIKKKNFALLNEIKSKIDQRTQLEKSYDTQENVEIKITRILKRLSLRDKITLQSLNKISIDHYIIVVNVETTNGDVIESFVKILSHLGAVKQSDSNKNILYIDFIMEKNNG